MAQAQCSLQDPEIEIELLRIPSASVLLQRQEKVIQNTKIQGKMWTRRIIKPNDASKKLRSARFPDSSNPLPEHI